MAQVRTMAEVARDSTTRQRLNLWLLAGFAGVALLLAGVGLYGVVSHSVTQRSREIGVRVALGADRGDVYRLVVGRAMGMTALGLAAGLAAALLATRLMETLLFGVAATDPWTLTGVAAFLSLVCLAASVVPGRRAARLEPTVVLGTPRARRGLSSSAAALPRAPPPPAPGR